MYKIVVRLRSFAYFRALDFLPLFPWAQQWPSVYSVNDAVHQAICILQSFNFQIEIFESDWINDMDHMRISGTEPSSVILSQTGS